MLLHSVISAGTYIAAKRALFELSPFELALVRFTGAGAVFGALLWRRHVHIARRDLVGLAVLGFVAVPLNQGFFLAGLSWSTPGHAALLYALTPIFVFVFARIRLGERATALKLVGIAVAFAGVVVVLTARGSVASTSAAIVAGTLLYLPVGLAASDLSRFRALSTVGWTSVAYLVALTSVAAYLLYYWALARAEASRVAIWSNLQPVLTALLAWGIYGERLTAPFLAGGAMVLAGVVLTERG